MDKSIIPECYADTLLIETLVPTEKGYNHQHNCFKVEATMKGLATFAVGIVDKDKKQIKYLDKFQVIDTVQGDLILWRHADKQMHHWIVQICPALERLLLKICEAEKIDISDLGVNALEGMKYYTKSTSRLNNPRLLTLFREIAKLNENVIVRKLRGWIQILKEKNYNVDINELINV